MIKLIKKNKNGRSVLGLICFQRKCKVKAHKCYLTVNRAIKELKDCCLVIRFGFKKIGYYEVGNKSFYLSLPLFYLLLFNMFFILLNEFCHHVYQGNGGIDVPELLC